MHDVHGPIKDELEEKDDMGDTSHIRTPNHQNQMNKFNKRNENNTSASLTERTKSPEKYGGENINLRKNKVKLITIQKETHDHSSHVVSNQMSLKAKQLISSQVDNYRRDDPRIQRKIGIHGKV